MTVTNEARSTLDNFATYKTATLSKLFNHDNAQLITGLSLNRHSGKYKGSMYLFLQFNSDELHGRVYAIAIPKYDNSYF